MGFWFDDSERQIIAQEQTTAAIKAQTRAIEYAADQARSDALQMEGWRTLGAPHMDPSPYTPLSAEDRSVLTGGLLSAISIIGGCIVFVVAVLKGFLFLLGV